jgi:integrase
VTVRIELEMLRVALKLACSLEVLASVIEWNMPTWKHGKQARHAWSVAEYERALLVAQPPKQRGVTRGHPPLRFSPDIQVQIMLGVDGLLRPGEIHHCAWEDTDLSSDAPQIHIVSKPEVGWFVKGEHDDSDQPYDRWVPLSPRLALALRKRWLEKGRPERGWIFPGRRDAERPITAFSGALARVCEHASVRMICPVELRHTGATIAAHEKGFGPEDLMAVGGWKSPQIPYSVYIKRDTGPAAKKMQDYEAAQAEAEQQDGRQRRAPRRHSVNVRTWKSMRRGRPRDDEGTG